MTAIALNDKKQDLPPPSAATLPEQATSTQSLIEKLKSLNQQAKASLEVANNTLAKLDIVEIEVSKELDGLGDAIKSEIETSRTTWKQDDEKTKQGIDRVSLTQTLTNRHVEIQNADKDRYQCFIITILVLIVLAFLAIALL